MKITKILTVAAGLLIVAACGQKAEQEPVSTDVADVDKTVGAGSTARASAMVLPATTSNDVALEHYMAGWADLENSRLTAAGNKFSESASADPSFAMAHLMAALSATSTNSFVSNLGQASANKAGASRGEQLLITAWEKYLASDAAGQIAALEELTSVHPDSPRAWVFLGDSYGSVNNSADARAAYKKAIALDAHLVPAHINLGNNLLTQDPKDYAQAETHFMHAVKLTPNEPNPHDLLGDVHRAQGNLEAAYKDYSKAAELAPDLGSPLQQRGHVNSFLGNYDEARADYTQSAKLEDARGSNAGGFFLIYRAYVNLHEGDHDAAIAELQEIVAGADAYADGADDMKVNALSNIALIASEAVNADVASKAIADAAAIMRQQAEELASDDLRDAQEATIAYMEGMLAARLKDSAAAAAKAAEYEGHVASNSNPRKLERMHEILGMDAFCQEDYVSAIEHFSAGDHMNNMYTKYYLARAHEAAGNTEDAARLYDELAVWNFNGPGYAMFRKEILAKAEST